MATVQPAPAATGSEAFAAAIAARDLDALGATLAPDVALHSPIVQTPFRGSDVIVDLYASLFEAFEEVRVTDDFTSADTYTFFWKGRMDGRDVEGVDRVRLNDDGMVADITVMARPLLGLSTFLSGMGVGFARRRRGRLVAKVLRLSTKPLAPLFSLFDPITRWLQRGRGGRRS